MRTRPTAELDPAAIAQLLLDSAAAAFGGAAPTRRYRAAGFAAQDLAACDGCDSQLTVSLTGTTPSGPGGRGAGIPQTSAQMLRGWSYTVELARTAPTLTDDGAPSADDLDESGAQHMSDYRTLDLWQRSLGYDSKIPDSLRDAGVGQIAPSNMQTIGPQGGVVAIRMTIVMNA